MADPPKAPPSSDIEGVNRDARVGRPSRDPQPDPGAAIDHARREGRGRPHGSAPPAPDRTGAGPGKDG